MFTFSVVVVDLPTDCILSFLFPAETDVLVPVFSQSTDVVVVNFVVVLKFPISPVKGHKRIKGLFTRGEGYPFVRVTLASELKLTLVYKQIYFSWNHLIKLICIIDGGSVFKNPKSSKSLR